MKSSFSEKVFTRFVKQINNNFEDSLTTEFILFLKRIFSLEDLIVILNNQDLEINLRTQLLRFFKIAYLSFTYNQQQINLYTSILINPVKVNHIPLIINDMIYYKFYELFIKINSSFDEIKKYHSIIYNELKNFKDLIEKNKTKTNKNILQFIEQGIIIPLYLYTHSFIAFLDQFTGYEYLKLYELVYQFLNFKKYITENKQLFEKFDFLILNNFFKNKNEQILNKSIEDKDLEKDIKDILNPNFEVLNFIRLYRILEKHLYEIIERPKSKCLIDFFSKKKENIDRNIIEKVKNKFSHLNSKLDQITLDLLLKYENDKQKLNNSHFIKILNKFDSDENNNYRNKFFNYLSFIFNHSKLNKKFKRQNYLCVLRLLQYDTSSSQKYLSFLYNKSKFNIFKIIEGLIQNIVFIFFCHFNPLVSKLNNQYYYAINSVKIIKYLCEEHNQEFQGIFFLQMNLDYINIKGITKVIPMFFIMIHILLKIIMLAKWEKSKLSAETQNQHSYYYDIFFAIIELLIEMIQGTKREYLNTLLEKNEENKTTLFHLFLTKVRLLLLTNKNESVTIYKVRKDIMDFIVTFLEEKNTPPKIILLISSILSPQSILDTIVATMKKLFIKLQLQKGNRNYKMKDYKSITFDYEMLNFFNNEFYFNKEFSVNPEYELANTMYKYVKLLADEYLTKDAINIINYIKKYSNKDLINIHRLKIKKTEDYSLGNKENFTIGDDIITNYFCIKFFEGITKTVIINFEEEGQSLNVRVLFTLNPLLFYLSQSSKIEFYNTVNRETRYSKLFSLMETSDDFIDEIYFYHKNFSEYPFLRIINKIDYLFIEKCLFVLSLGINFILFTSLIIEGTGENIESSTSTSSLHFRNLKSKLNTTISNSSNLIIFVNYYNEETILNVLVKIHIVITLLFLIIWFLTKFPLYYRIERKKYALKYKVMKNLMNIRQKIVLTIFYSILLKNKINVFILNIICSLIGINSSKLIVFYSFQLLSIINLSETLKNIVRSITLRYKQFLATTLFVVIIINVFTSIAFYCLSNEYFIEEDVSIIIILGRYQIV